MANPTLSTDAFTSVTGTSGSTMTMGGTQAKIAILGALCLGSGYFAWNSPASLPLVIGGAVIGLILALVITFKPAMSPILAPLYAIAEGGVLGALSKVYETQFHGIVLQAVLVTAAVFCATLAAYVTRIIRPTQRFVSIVTAATGGILLFYLVSFVLSLFRITLFSFSGPFSILISVVICGVAAANLIIDYAVIESGIESQAPKYMEWYSAFGLLVTVVWLYLEILRLLAKLQKRD